MQKKSAQAEERKVDDGVINTAGLIKHAEVVAYAPNGYEKVTISTVSSSLFFAKNKANVNWKVAGNKNEDNYNALKNNTSDVDKGWEVKDITINGWASPEGEETFNEGLSQRRAETAAKYMRNKLKKAKVEITDDKYIVNGNGPDWNGFMNAVQASNLKDKNAIINVVNSADESKKEEEIRNMILIYPELERDILPPLRRAIINVNTFVPKRTDSEIAQLATSADFAKLDVHEILYAATLTGDLNTKKQIYTHAMSAYPNCWVAVVNAAAVELEMGNNDEAMNLLSKAKDMDKAQDAWEFRNNMGIAQFRKGDVKHAEGCFNKAQELGADENYNLGLVAIAKGDYGTAASNLSASSCDFNLGLAQVLNEDYAGADKTLGCASKDANTYYLLAISAARQENKSVMLDNLGQAFKANADLKSDAAKDRSFLKYFKDVDFQALVK
jgi:tetratricopeptide (TPR) repeat protein